MLVLCDELAGSARRLAAGLTVSDENLAVEASGRAAAGSSFLLDEHTLAHMRSAMWAPGLFERSGLEDWQGRGSANLQRRLRGRLRELLG
jgi:trimethylamine:corrinoid methyltransferase-like protein